MKKVSSYLFLKVAPLQNPTEDQLSLQSRYKDEMRSLAESIFFIFYQIPISVEETDTLVRKEEESKKKAREQRKRKESCSEKKKKLF